jgi:hypothetical protein
MNQRNTVSITTNNHDPMTDSSIKPEPGETKKYRISKGPFFLAVVFITAHPHAKIASLLLHGQGGFSMRDWQMHTPHPSTMSDEAIILALRENEHMTGEGIRVEEAPRD